MSYHVSPFESPPLIARPPSTRNSGNSSAKKRRPGTAAVGGGSSSSLRGGFRKDLVTLLPVRLGAGTRGIAERGDKFIDRDTASQNAFDAWLKKKRESGSFGKECKMTSAERERQLELTRQFQRQAGSQVDLHGAGAAADQDGDADPENADELDERSRQRQRRRQEQRSPQRSPSPATRERAHELYEARKESATRRMWSQAERVGHIVEDKQHEKSELKAELQRQRAQRRAYIAAIASEHTLAQKQARAETEALLREEMAGAVGAMGALQRREGDAAPLDPRLVVHRMNEARAEEAARRREEAVRRTDGQREERRRAEAELRERRRAEADRNADLHDEIVVEEKTSARLRADAVQIRQEVVQGETAAERERWRGFVGEQEEGRRARLKQLAEERKDAEARRYEHRIQHYERVQSARADVLGQRASAKSTLRHRAAAREESAHSAAMKTRGADIASPRMLRLEQCCERQLMATRMRSDLEERRAEYELEAQREMRARREECERQRMSRATSRATSRPGSSAVRGGSARSATAHRTKTNNMSVGGFGGATNNHNSNSQFAPEGSSFFW